MGEELYSLWEVHGYVTTAGIGQLRDGGGAILYMGRRWLSIGRRDWLAKKQERNMHHFHLFIKHCSKKKVYFLSEHSVSSI